MIPWSSLGVSDENASDGYYNRYTYQVPETATNRTADSIAGLTGGISIHYQGPAQLGSPNIGNQSNDCSAAGSNPCAAVVVVVSHGSNGFGAYNSNGELLASPTGADEIENTNNDSRFVAKEFSEDPADPYDDVLMSLTASDLITPLIIRGILQDPRADVSGDFAQIKGAVISDAIRDRTGLIPGTRVYNLPDSAELFSMLSESAETDPWGQDYQYSVTTPSINILTSPAAVAFTVSSTGPNGVAGDADDSQITYTVGDLQDYFLNTGW